MPSSVLLKRLARAPTLVSFIFPRRRAALVCYAAVGTRGSVPGFEVSCSSLSAHLVLEAPAGETGSLKPRGGEKEEGGKRYFFFLPSSPSRVHFSLQKPTRT